MTENELLVKNTRCCTLWDEPYISIFKEYLQRSVTICIKSIKKFCIWSKIIFSEPRRGRWSSHGVFSGAALHLIFLISGIQIRQSSSISSNRLLSSSSDLGQQSISKYANCIIRSYWDLWNLVRCTSVDKFRSSLTKEKAMAKDTKSIPRIYKLRYCMNCDLVFVFICLPSGMFCSLSGFTSNWKKLFFHDLR